MSLAFIYDMTMLKKDNKNYNYMFTNSILEFYKSIDVDLYLCCIYENISSELQYNYIDSTVFKALELKKMNSIKNYMNNYIYNKRQLNFIIRKVDKVIIRVPSSVALYAIKLCNKYNKQYIVEVVGCAFEAYKHHSLKGKIVCIPAYLNERKAVKVSKNVVYVTSKYLQKKYPTTHNNTDFSDIEIVEVLKPRMLNKSSNEIFTLGTVGNVDIRYKGQQYVIKAISELYQMGYNFRYELVGGGNNTNLLEYAKKMGVNQLVSFKGPLQHDEVFDWLDSIDIYIHPSLTEGLSRSIMEAMSRGLPSCGSNVGGIPELLEKECLFEKGNVDEIKAILIKMIDSKYYSELSNRSNIKIKELLFKYTFDKKIFIYNSFLSGE